MACVLILRLCYQEFLLPSGGAVLACQMQMCWGAHVNGDVSDNDVSLPHLLGDEAGRPVKTTCPSAPG